MRESVTVPKFRIEAIDCVERPVRFRLPFRFGAATLTEAPQAFVRIRIRLTGRSNIASGFAAEMMMPKWFDKNPALGNDDNITQLRDSLSAARAAYLSDRAPDTAFGHHARHYRSLVGSRTNPLLASYGPALIDRAIIDALARALHASFFTLLRSNGVGFAPDLLLPEFSRFDAGAFLASLHPRTTVAARHTIGLADPLADDDPGAAAIDDPLPRTLPGIIARYGHRWFKIKLSGDVAADVARLTRIAPILDAAGNYQATLDGNERFAGKGEVEELWLALSREPALSRFAARIAFVEQPLARESTLSSPAPALDVPVIIDESDGDIESFPKARACGYRGVSSKSCKGLYKSLINLARVRRWNNDDGSDRYLVSAEDLTMQAGVAVQQDLALVSLLGIGHVERNGHHYVDGMSGAPPDEQRAFTAAHPDLYERRDGEVRLRIENGQLALESLGCIGFGYSPQGPIEALFELEHYQTGTGS